jgi:hypothetical protein
MNQTCKIQTTQFIEALYSRYFQGRGGYCEFRIKEKSSDICEPIFFKPKDLDDEALEGLQDLNLTCHIFFGVNPRPRNQDKKEADIKDVVCLWADVDGKDFKNGKDEARAKIEAFPIKPNILVDSGHGFHSYWLLREPLYDITDEQRLDLKRILSGIARSLQADRHSISLSGLARLPGTKNIKDSEPLDCSIIHLETTNLYSLEDFADFKDQEYQEPSQIDVFPVLGSKELIISLDDTESARADVLRLVAPPRTRNRILTGALLTGDNNDKSRSGRDFSIICSLIYHDYNYPTIRSIFFNPFLKCSNRIRGNGEALLQRDVRNAYAKVNENKGHSTPQREKITRIKRQYFPNDEDKVREIASYITMDLLSGSTPAGTGFKDESKQRFYFFDREEKILMDTEGMDFYLYVRDRYGIPKKDFSEVKDSVMTKIWSSDSRVEARRFAYFDKASFTLYISNHDNSIYKMDGEHFQVMDNGTDGVFFAYEPENTPFDIHPEELERAERYFSGTSSAATRDLGFRSQAYLRGDSMLRRFLIDMASLSDEQGLNAEEQKCLLTLYFYSLFFESTMEEKPILCFVGLKESGKSTLATLMGKALFGDRFLSLHCPDDLDDMRTVLGENYYLVFDNVDHFVKSNAIDALCAAATGATIQKRKLYTDSDTIRIHPRVFLVITTREAKFKRDDLVSRLLIFGTQRITKPRPRADLYRYVEENRNSIMAEVLVNLNSIIRILKAKRHMSPECVSRIADWEAFGRKVCDDGDLAFPELMARMNKTKDEFTLEDDLLYALLDEYIVVKGYKVVGETANELYERLVKWADDLKIKDFARRYKSPRAVAQRLSNIRDGLAQVMMVEVRSVRGGRKAYSFSQLPEAPPAPIEEALLSAEEAFLKDLEERSSPAELEPGAFDFMEEMSGDAEEA